MSAGVSDIKTQRALYHINPDFQGVYLPYFMFEEVFYENTST